MNVQLHIIADLIKFETKV